VSSRVTLAALWGSRTFQLTKVEEVVPVVARIVADVATLEERTQAAARARLAAATAAVAAATPSPTKGTFVTTMSATDSSKLSAGVGGSPSARDHDQVSSTAASSPASSSTSASVQLIGALSVDVPLFVF
jgi:hypothetical protein